MDKRTMILIERNKSKAETSDKAYIEKRVKIDPVSNCWIWQLTLGKDGYGKAKRRGQTIRAHRLSYLTFCGDIPSNLFVCHRCDTPACVNPSHLWIGTHFENELDKTNKGRRSPSPAITHPETIPKGEQASASVLNAKQVEEVYVLGMQNMLAKEIKAKLGLKVSESAICRILNGATWKHLKLAEKHGVPKPQNIGERNPTARLTAEKVRFIRLSELPSPELAKKFNVDVGTIYAVKHNKTWKHVV